MENLGSKIKINEFVSKVAMTSWSIWKARNEFVFQQTPVVVKNIAIRMEQAWEELCTVSTKAPADCPAPQPVSSSVIAKWRAPDQGRFKFNCDASWKKEFGGGFGAIILRNHKGDLLNEKKFKVIGNSALICEAMALREACFMAKALNLRSVEIESDNKDLIALSVSELVPPWDYACLIHDIRVLVSDLNLSLLWIPRQVNRVVHWVASFVAGLLPQNWVSNIPTELSVILSSDF